MRDPTLSQQLDRLAEALTPVARVCHELGRPLGIENHGDYYTSDLVELCRRVPHLGIFLDTGNTYLIGERSVPACREAAPLTIGTHFRDHYVHPDPHSLTFVIDGAPLGQGDVGLAQVYRDLLDLAPPGRRLIMHWEMVAPKGMHPRDCLEESWRFVRSLPEG
jgi:sugar phosphate isomerase/epimerase